MIKHLDKTSREVLFLMCYYTNKAIYINLSIIFRNATNLYKKEL